MHPTADLIEVGDWFLGTVERADLMGQSAQRFPGEKVRVLMQAPHDYTCRRAASLFAALPAGHTEQVQDGTLWVVGTRPGRSRLVTVVWWQGPPHETRDALTDLVADIKAGK